MKPLALGVVGTGSMGRNHVRVARELAGVELRGIYDSSGETAGKVAREFGVPAFTSVEELAREVAAVVLAVPTVSHADVGTRLLAAGKHLLVEKPLAASLEEADRLLAAAEDAGRVLAVGHVEFYNPAVEALLAAAPGPSYLEVERLSVFSPRSLDVDVILDLMIHDLQILHAFDPSPVAEIRATGIAVLSERVDIANVRLELESGCVANLAASRISAERVRKLRVFLPGRRRYYSLDYREQEVKGYRVEDTPAGRSILPDDLPVERQEPLRRELAAFAAACRGEEARYADGASGRRALKTALAVAEAIGG